MSQIRAFQPIAKFPPKRTKGNAAFKSHSQTHYLFETLSSEVTSTQRLRKYIPRCLAQNIPISDHLNHSLWGELVPRELFPVLSRLRFNVDMILERYQSHNLFAYIIARQLCPKLFLDLPAILRHAVVISSRNSLNTAVTSLGYSSMQSFTCSSIRKASVFGE